MTDIIRVRPTKAVLCEGHLSKCLSQCAATIVKKKNKNAY